MKTGIYSITNLVNNKKYVGKSISIHNKFYQHKTHLRRNEHVNTYLQHAWNKYKEENFVFEVLEECSLEQLQEKEIYWINFYQCLYTDKGYNLVDENKATLIEEGKNKSRKQVCKIDSTNQIVQTWESIYLAAKDLDIDIKRMYAIMYGSNSGNGKIRLSYKGNIYMWSENFEEGKDYFSEEGKVKRKERTDYPDTAGAILVVNNENYILQRFENTTEAAIHFNLSKDQMNNRLSEGRFINNTLVIREKYFDATKDYFTKPAPKERDCPSKSIINIETGEIYVFTSYKKAEEQLGLKSNKLYEVVKGNKPSYKGWKAYIN
jgi:group I intron endonuclease